MTVLYLCDQDLDNGSGVSQKIMMQAKQWHREGHEVKLLSLISLSYFSAEGERLTPPRLHVRRRGFGIFAHLLAGSRKLGALLQDESFDLVYMRYRLYSPFFKAALGGAPQVVEINSDDRGEYRRGASKLLAGYNRLFRSRFLGGADAFVCVSRELARMVAPFGKPSAVIANGVDTALFPFAPQSGTVRPSLVFIGSKGQPWHGVGKIEGLARRMPDFDFHIVGTEGTDGANLFYHGFMPPERNREFIPRHDVGIGTLSLYENGMEEASPLKTRQYLAQGLPILYAYEDTDLPPDAPFALRLPNTPGNTEAAAARIEAFVRRAYHDAALRREARAFAEAVLDVRVKERRRLDFFAEVLAG